MASGAGGVLNRPADINAGRGLGYGSAGRRVVVVDLKFAPAWVFRVWPTASMFPRRTALAGVDRQVERCVLRKVGMRG